MRPVGDFEAGGARRISRRRLRRVARGPVQLTLELGDPLVLRNDALLKELDLLVQTQQHSDDHVSALLIDRLRVSPLHTTRFDNARLCPPTQLNAYQSPPVCRSFREALHRTRTDDPFLTMEVLYQLS